MFYVLTQDDDDGDDEKFKPKMEYKQKQVSLTICQMNNIITQKRKNNYFWVQGFDYIPSKTKIF